MGCRRVRPSRRAAARVGEVVEVRHPDGTPPYLVRWTDDDRETLFFPGPETHVKTYRER
ncbi:DUF1918 domain-containing protein [Yinghuangia aomiensis]